MAKQRIHREWFRPVSLGGRKSCPNCRSKLEEGESVWSWGEYVRAKWRTVAHLCRSCWHAAAEELVKHKDGCGCTFELVGYRCDLPEWMTLDQPCEV